MVPRWVRGRESLEIVSPHPQPLPMLGLGNSVGTPPEGIEADLLVVVRLRRARAPRRAKRAGRIVLFNVPFTDYGATVAYRTSGPSRAARAGAVAVPRPIRRPRRPAHAAHGHADLSRRRATDSRGRDPGRRRAAPAAHGGPRPARAPAPHDGRRDAARRRFGQRHRRDSSAASGPTRSSSSAATSTRGTSAPARPTMAAGASSAWEVARLMKTLDLRPRRTVRVVLFTNEENGLRGGLDYRDRTAQSSPTTC